MKDKKDNRDATKSSHRLSRWSLAVLLVEQCHQKRLVPTSGPVAGMPSCSVFDPFGTTNRHLLGEG